MKIASIVGARPQFIKVAVISRAIQTHNLEEGGSAPVKELIIHTGQHYDDNMSRVFFEELDLPEPHHHLGISGPSHGAMTGRMLEAVERVLLEESPDWVMVYGDTNSTLAGALAAAKLNIPVAHVEAGLRSFNRRMPEEVNRVLTDHVASLLFCPTRQAVENLLREGFGHVVDLEAGAADPGSGGGANPNRGSYPVVYQVGDVMYDAALYYGPKAERASRILEDLGLAGRSYVLATVHRAENTDDPRRLAEIFRGLAAVAEKLPVVVPVHPRTRKELEKAGVSAGSSGLRLLDPVGYLDMMRLEKQARVIVTDSGGVQKEAFFYGVPCVTLRQETEWTELVALGWNRLVGTKADSMVQAVEEMAAAAPFRPGGDGVYGHGAAGKLILGILLGHREPGGHWSGGVLNGA